MLSHYLSLIICVPSSDSTFPSFSPIYSHPKSHPTTFPPNPSLHFPSVTSRPSFSSHHYSTHCPAYLMYIIPSPLIPSPVSSPVIPSSSSNPTSHFIYLIFSACHFTITCSIILLFHHSPSASLYLLIPHLLSFHPLPSSSHPINFSSHHTHISPPLSLLLSRSITSVSLHISVSMAMEIHAIPGVITQLTYYLSLRSRLYCSNNYVYIKSININLKVALCSHIKGWCSVA